ncbi:MAG: peptide chain release factor N(5)-glutamine methyltransferase [Lachnospiraceae bacterium]|nr:peptide chain release factor N(5)-glutamine methyltransferase [Lachnospiraceae bacterium]
MTIKQAQEEGGKRLQAAGIEEATFETTLILEESVGMGRAEMLAHPETELADKQEERFLALVKSRESRIPLAYLLGRQEFMGLTFAVSPGVLIPRADTETLVEEVLRHLLDGMRILDLCTGSGCIALSLLHYSNGTTALATDISEDALAVAADNATALGLGDRFTTIRTDLWPDTAERFDLITANPPYIETAVLEGLQPEVRDREPRIALDGGEDGLRFYRRIVSEAPAHLCADGWLFTEIGFDQGERVRQLFVSAGFHEVSVIRDLGGNDRVVKGCWF